MIAPVPDSALKSAKAALRQRVLAAREAIGAPERAAASAAITNRLIRLEPYRRSRTVSAYSSFGSEFDTTEFIADIVRNGKRLVLPRVDRVARGLVFHFVLDPDSELIAGTWGIREPDPARCPIADVRDIEFILVPGVAFSRACDRLGYGGGYYDRILSQVRPDCQKVSAAFSLQIVDALPTGPGDRKVQSVLTESDTLEGGI